MEGKKNEQIKSLISNICGCLFATQYTLSLLSFVPNFIIQSQVVAEKSLTEKKLQYPLKRKNNEQIKGLVSYM